MENVTDPKLDGSRAQAIRCMGCMAPDAGTIVCPSCGWRKTSSAQSVLHLAPGTLLRDCYLVGRVLGQGGFGITYIGWDTQLERKIAIKEYFPQAIASRMPASKTVAPTSAQVQGDYAYGLRGFMNEGRILARFSDHPCIVSVLNLFEANDTGYLLMGYLDGTTLAQALATAGGKFSFPVAREILMRVMDGLREVHAQGLLHRDISPDNIYLTRQGPVKILDFGAARFEVSERSQSLSVVLREGYAPEEQYRRNGHQGAWTDVYAVAATLYRSITGVTPPPALDRLHSDALRTPRELGVAIPADAEAALMRGLAVQVDNRFKSVESFQEALRDGVADARERDFKVSSPHKTKKAKIPVYVYLGIASFVISFFLPAVGSGSNGYVGWQCAQITLKLLLTSEGWKSLLIFACLINPLMAIYAIARLLPRLIKLRPYIAALLLVCIPMTWVCLARMKLSVEIGHVMWIIGILLILVPELTAYIDRRKARSAA